MAPFAQQGWLRWTGVRQSLPRGNGRGSPVRGCGEGVVSQWLRGSQLVSGSRSTEQPSAVERRQAGPRGKDQDASNWTCRWAAHEMHKEVPRERIYIFE